jgi:hypothetical protein
MKDNPAIETNKDDKKIPGLLQCDVLRNDTVLATLRRVLLVFATVAQLLKKVLVFYETQQSIPVFTTMAIDRYPEQHESILPSPIIHSKYQF